ncbi:hypothetical protein RB597_003331 [Gaeumannomyces tritici]
MHFHWRTLALVVSSLITQAAAQSSSSSSSSTSATAAPTSTPSPGALRQSVFVSPNQELAFGISIPADSEDIYFTLAGQPAGGWAAVGLGSATMAGNPLILMVYASTDGANVTFSPRLATRGRAEPTPLSAADSSSLRVTALPGTGLINGTLVYRARCAGCRRWPGGGSLDVAATALPCIYGAGPSFFRSDDAAAPLKMHHSFGSFTLDLRAATAAAAGGGGVAGAPVLDKSTTLRSVGATLGGVSRTGKRDWAAVAHAVVMIFCFVGLLPLGVLMLRVGEWVRPHGITQGVAVVGIIVGFGLGVHVSGRYNRSKDFNSAHQVIGILVFIFLLAQFVIGFLHHRNHRKSQSQAEVPVPTPKKTLNLRPVHIWLGRSVMVMGIINAFLGFPFALSPGYNLVLAPIALAILFISTVLLFLKGFLRRRLFGKKSPQPEDDAPPSYTQEPWRQPYPMGTSAGATAAPLSPGAPRGGGMFGLSGLRGLMKGSGGGGGADGPSAKGMELGSRQHPRELV